jgi:hypothetical protein
MKLSIRMPTLPRLRTLFPMAIAATLISCGGGSPAFILSGTVSGLVNPGLALENKGTTLSIPVGSTSYMFPNKISVTTEFNIQIKTQPAFQTCTIRLNVGSAGTTSTNNADIVCIRNAFDLSGNITGLTTDGLVLVNGFDTLAVPANTSAFVLPRVNGGDNYNVRVQTQPAGKICTIINGSGTFAEAPVSNVQVNCI